MKTCARCSREHPLENFHKNPRTRDRRGSYCKPCASEFRKEWKERTGYKDPVSPNKLENDRRHYAKNHAAIREAQVDQRLRSRYGITTADYDRMLQQQNYRCAICNTDKPGGRGNRFHVDHDHETGKVRALLCWTCNVRLGTIENSEWVALATEYLSSHR